MPRRDPEFLKRLFATFRIEAEDHLAALSAGLIELEKVGPTGERAEIVETIFREAHSLKGAARAVNQAEIEAVCQAMETIFDGMKRGEVALSPDLLDALLQAIDGAGLALSPDEKTSAGARSRLTALAHQLRTLPKADDPAPPDTAAPDTAVPDTATPDGTAQPQASDPPATRQGDSPPDAPDVPDMPDVSDAPTAPEPPPTHPSTDRAQTKVSATGAIASAVPATPSAADTIRVSAARMDSLLLAAEELISIRQAISRRAAELQEIQHSVNLWRKEREKTENALRTVSQNGASQNGAGKSERATAILELAEWDHTLLESIEERLTAVGRAAEQDSHTLGGMVETLLQEMKQIMMLPFSSLLELLPRLVRDLARDQAKDVEAVITGQDIEVERRILQEMKDPLIHLVRNCIDHGIEKPHERIAGGKPPRGTVRIAVTQREDGKVELLIADDGAGIDIDRVRNAALRLRLISAENASTINDQTLAAFVFHSGLSTSPIITDLSGRGLGLAIVREKVERLGGTISLESVPGAGATFRMVLPTTVATMRGVLVQVQAQRFVFPTTYVEKVARVPRDVVRTVENRETIRMAEIALAGTHSETASDSAGEDGFVPLVRLGQVLQIPGSAESAAELYRDEQGNMHSGGSQQRIHLLLVHADGRRVAFVVDQIIGEQEVLVKSLGPQLARVRNIAGATVMGTGQVVPILHISDLVKSAIRFQSAPQRQGDPVFPQAPGDPARRAAILVVEDSITARMQLQSILELAGYDVQTAVDGMDGILALRGRKFDLVVSDVEMPRLNGFDLTAKIRADSRLAELPVVLVTALDSAQDRERGIDVGADAYIVKSDFDQSNLLDVIRRLIVAPPNASE